MKMVWNKGKKYTEEQRKSFKEYWESKRGIKLDDETKKRMSKAHKKRKERLGYINSPETRKKLSMLNRDYQKGNKYRLGKKHTLETIEKIRETLRKKYPKGRPINSGCFTHGKTKGDKNINWNGGSSFAPYSVDWTKTLKRSIRERDKYICQICYKEGNFVHHIDYNKKNCNPDNLINLCNGCHTMTNHNRDKWIEFFNKRLKYNVLD